MYYKKVYIAIFIILSLIHFSCTLKRQLYTIHEVNKLKKGETTYLKAHMKNGSVYVLHNWIIDEKARTVSGSGYYWSYERFKKNKNVMHFTLSIDDVSLFETNTVMPSRATLAMTFITGYSVGLTIYCATNPKACFGSCPTFYVDGGGEIVLSAEGFTESVLPVFEEKDIDALFYATPHNGILKLILTNEAMETHVIRYVNLLTAPVDNSKRVFKTPDDKFFEVEDFTSPLYCNDKVQDCTEQITVIDKNERFSQADDNDLAEKEEIILIFHNIKEKNPGLVIAYRQTLLTTFLFYQHLAFMGESAGYYLGRINSLSIQEARKIKERVEKILGGIEFYIKKNDRWKYIGKVKEMGPIATNIELITMSEKIDSETLEVKLRMTKGMWRIDYISLVNVLKEVNTEKIPPSKILKDNIERPDILEKLMDNDQIFVTLPGDRYEIVFNLPENKKYEYFLETSGYYLEWMREEWIKEENPAMLLMSKIAPGRYLKMLSQDYKKIEATMEDSFWKSKYEKK